MLCVELFPAADAIVVSRRFEVAQLELLVSHDVPRAIVLLHPCPLQQPHESIIIQIYSKHFICNYLSRTYFNLIPCLANGRVSMDIYLKSGKKKLEVETK